MPLCHNTTHRLYERGVGVKRNEWLAVEHYEEARRLGSPYGMSLLALCYAVGTGVSKDTVRSLTLFEEAARGGDKYAISVLKGI